jgi:four helix bundle protein
MAARLEELVVWQLADELRTKIHAITAHGPASRDCRFCNQLRDAASSVARNTAEGFGRYQHGESAQFLTIARGSAFEVKDHFKDGAARKYWSATSANELERLCHRTIAALTRFIRYLKSSQAP